MYSSSFDCWSFLIWWVETNLCAIWVWWYSTYSMHFEIKHHRIFLWLHVYTESRVYDTASGVSSSASAAVHRNLVKCLAESLSSNWPVYKVTVHTHWDRTFSLVHCKDLQPRCRGWEWSEVSTAENVTRQKESCSRAVNILTTLNVREHIRIKHASPRSGIFLSQQGHL